jgi:hypothetical protein
MLLLTGCHGIHRKHQGKVLHAGTRHAPRTLPASDPSARMSELRKPHDAGGDYARPGGL